MNISNNLLHTCMHIILRRLHCMSVNSTCFFELYWNFSQVKYSPRGIPSPPIKSTPVTLSSHIFLIDWRNTITVLIIVAIPAVSFQAYDCACYNIFIFKQHCQNIPYLQIHIHGITVNIHTDCGDMYLRGYVIIMDYLLLIIADT